jgi:hypothetical protein
MLRQVVSAALVVSLALGSVRGVRAEEKKNWIDTEMKRFQGRWVTTRESPQEIGTVRPRRLVLEFTDRSLAVTNFEANGVKTADWRFSVLRIEQGEGAMCLVLGRDGTNATSVVHYDFIGNQMFLLGGCPGGRPICGYSVSGTFRHEEAPKREEAPE